jgi:hypothetical protein
LKLLQLVFMKPELILMELDFKDLLRLLNLVLGL